ncbi:MAG TPA: DEAD/DEAH box helicase [Nitrospiraceae bacterium]|jgi:DEAD/DEAH box helicase domain-containing protein|nr:DEAD/DEAH box helicase [Nitrospiraceae bacterium]
MSASLRQGINGFIQAQRADLRFAQQIAEYRYLPPVAAKYAEIALDGRLKEVLAKEGIAQLWSHQVDAIKAIRNGDHVVVMTPTASGKSLIYNIPVIESFLEDEAAKALYIFPLKGLEQDQVKNLNRLLSTLGLEPEKGPRERTPLQAAEVYDGDTTAFRRKKIRDRSTRAIFTNPDMLHLAINPFHALWAEFLKQLKYVVVDEIHAYRGVFGTNAAHVFRRLRRICRYYGSNPQFIACSATIANPKELAERLIGAPFRAITESGAPQGGKHFFFLNPPGSPYTEAARLLRHCLEAGLRAIVFTKARKITELIYSWAVARADDLAAKIRPYRAGFLPRERREIEQKLFRGELRGVISTSALELGVDIGGLDVCILVGYPGSIASTWQRIGRVGRHAQESLIFLIALRDALDQYFMRHPDAFFGKSHEAVVIDPNNPTVLKKHLPCAAAEISLRADDQIYEVQALQPLIDDLVAAGDLHPGKRGDIWFTARRRPQRTVGIRSIGDPFSIVLEGTGETIGDLDTSRVFREAFPGAIYLHQGQQYRVIKLDLERRRAYCKPAAVQYYTQALTEEETQILAEQDSRRIRDWLIHWGCLRMTRRVVGYDKRGLFDGTRLSRHALELPASVFETEGLWIGIDPETRAAIASRGYDLGGSLHAVEHAAISCLPLFVLCDKGDIGGYSYPLYPPLASPAIFIYDGYEGGLGFTRRALEVLEDWLRATARLIGRCPCEEGCPACVQDPQCGSGNKPLDKDGAIFLLDRWLGEQISSGPITRERRGS